jgi:hypothetical protein
MRHQQLAPVYISYQIKLQTASGRFVVLRSAEEIRHRYNNLCHMQASFSQSYGNIPVFRLVCNDITFVGNLIGILQAILTLQQAHFHM